MATRFNAFDRAPSPSPPTPIKATRPDLSVWAGHFLSRCAWMQQRGFISALTR
jgi:hypothetical protein